MVGPPRSFTMSKARKRTKVAKLRTDDRAPANGIGRVARNEGGSPGRGRPGDRTRAASLASVAVGTRHDADGVDATVLGAHLRSSARPPASAVRRNLRSRGAA